MSSLPFLACACLPPILCLPSRLTRKMTYMSSSFQLKMFLPGDFSFFFLDTNSRTVEPRCPDWPPRQDSLSGLCLWPFHAQCMLLRFLWAIFYSGEQCCLSKLSVFPRKPMALLHPQSPMHGWSQTSIEQSSLWGEATNASSSLLFYDLYRVSQRVQWTTLWASAYL